MNNGSCTNFGFSNEGNCCCNFPALVILILIILQFGRGFKREEDDDDEHCKTQLIDNSILFIIALFFLSCCNPCRKQFS